MTKLEYWKQRCEVAEKLANIFSEYAYNRYIPDSYKKWKEFVNTPEPEDFISPDVAEKLLKIREAFVEEDYEEVWHWLYSITDPNYDKSFIQKDGTKPWEELEQIAGRLNK